MREILEELKSKVFNPLYANEDKFIDIYFYALSLHDTDILNFNLRGTRYEEPAKGKLYAYNSFDLDCLNHNYLSERGTYIKKEKNGKMLKKEIKVSVVTKPNLKVFKTKEEMVNSYENDLRFYSRKINKKIEELNNFKGKISQNLIKAENV